MSRRTTLPEQPRPMLTLSSVFVYGAGAGLLGVATMTITEKIEQAFTARPNSLVPAYTLARLIGIGPKTSRDVWRLNMIMHYGQGAIAGVLRALMSYYGVRGPFSDFMFIGIRLCIDQTLENLTNVGALPWTWPVSEQIVDILHKTVFALCTGYLTDRWIQ